jgi:hypothetical protein
MQEVYAWTCDYGPATMKSGFCGGGRQTPFCGAWPFGQRFVVGLGDGDWNALSGALIWVTRLSAANTSPGALIATAVMIEVLP